MTRFLKRGKMLNEKSLVEKLEGEMVDVSATIGWIESEYGEEAPIQSPFDYYIVVLEDCKIRTDDGEEIERLEVALRTINSVGEDDGKKAARETEFFDELNYARKRLRNAKEILERESDSK